MATVWRNALVLVFVHLVVSQTRFRCGEPPKYPDKQLDIKYIYRPVFNHQDKVSYRCHRGHVPSEGNRMSFCMRGRWTPLTLKCQKVKCNGLADIKNGQYRREGQSYGDKAIVICNQGYVLKGVKFRMCLEKGWSGTDPVCLAPQVTCSAPTVENRWIKPGERTQYTTQDTVSITCSEGFDLIGSSVVTCGPNGQWRDLPECHRKVPKMTCPAPAVENRSIKPGERTQYTPQDTVSITCSEGFDLIGSSLVTCGPDGQWQNLPKCHRKVILCSAPAVANGRINAFGNQHKPRDTVSITCSEGFELIGSPQVTCGPDGQWQSLPECHPKRRSANVIFCSAPVVANGRINAFGNQHKPKDTVSITCSEGFELIGSSQVTCGPDGQWQGLPECHPKKHLVNVNLCSAPAVANGRINEFGNTFKPKDTVSIICSEGFDLIGSPQVTCGPDGQWQSLPECHPKTRLANGKCGPPPSYLHHNVFFREGTPSLTEYSSGARIRYKCNLGLRRASGSDIIRCQAGEWTKLALRCQRKSCGSAGEISFGRFQYSGVLFGDSARAICQEGYELIGPEERVCRDGGWDGRIPVCEPVYCPPPPEVKDAEVSDFRNEDVPVGHMVSYRCQTGALIGTQDLYCTTNGTWSGPAPLCKDISCPRPDIPRGSRMRGFRSVYKYGNTVTIACSPGLRLYGESFVTCGADGNWTPKLPECRR
ncbi:sushi, von Willebrand factor type A, EGF and pentraxin domain-containing protein 1 isoform X1 [Danio rerio]|uniref:Sushi, von Willebrand factor type A, EGF and pentraxin domain-containing protein 1 isoform X1 n=1 Tax=Danio rerio TaxID=7955 RepID=A0A8M3B6F5_DANRE